MQATLHTSGLFLELRFDESLHRRNTPISICEVEGFVSEDPDHPVLLGTLQAILDQEEVDGVMVWPYKVLIVPSGTPCWDDLDLVTVIRVILRDSDEALVLGGDGDPVPTSVLDTFRWTNMSGTDRQIVISRSQRQ
jgi:hypothetical protein